MSNLRRFIKRIRRLSPPSRLVLRYGMAAVALHASVLAIVVHDTLATNALYAALYYPPTVEFIYISFTLVVCGALLFDIVYHQTK